MAGIVYKANIRHHDDVVFNYDRLGDSDYDYKLYETEKLYINYHFILLDLDQY